MAYLPDPEIVVRLVLLDSDATVSATAPANLATHLPHVTAYRIGGAAVHPKFLDSALMQVSAWAGSYDDAAELASTCRDLLFDAWQSQWTTEGAHVHRVTEITGPTAIRTSGQPDNVFRSDATYRVTVRPDA